VGVAPEAALGGAGFGFGGGVGGVLVVVLVVPGVAGAEHFEIDVASIDENLADGAPVAVGVLNPDCDFASGDERCEMLRRRLAERLGFLRRVDPVKAYLVLSV